MVGDDVTGDAKSADPSVDEGVCGGGSLNVCQGEGCNPPSLALNVGEELVVTVCRMERPNDVKVELTGRWRQSTRRRPKVPSDLALVALVAVHAEVSDIQFHPSPAERPGDEMFDGMDNGMVEVLNLLHHSQLQLVQNKHMGRDGGYIEEQVLARWQLL